MSERRFPKLVAIGVGVFFAVAGLWALVAPQSFFDAAAAFDPYNQHFVQDIGAFQIGLGAVLLLTALDPAADGLASALLGSGAGAAAHVISHVAGIDLGGTPTVDIPVFSVVAGLLVAAGIVRRMTPRREG